MYVRVYMCRPGYVHSYRPVCVMYSLGVLEQHFAEQKRGYLSGVQKLNSVGGWRRMLCAHMAVGPCAHRAVGPCATIATHLMNSSVCTPTAVGAQCRALYG